MAGRKRIEDLCNRVENLTLVTLYRFIPPHTPNTDPFLTKRLMLAFQTGIVQYGLLCTQGNVAAAAKLCGMNRNTFMRVMRDAGLTSRSERSRSRSSSSPATSPGV